MTLSKDGEGKLQNPAHLVMFLDENNDEESRESCEDGTQSEVSNDVEYDTIIGRVYNYDYAVKLLVLSKFSQWSQRGCAL